jgi:hypothetical protein
VESLIWRIISSSASSSVAIVGMGTRRILGGVPDLADWVGANHHRRYVEGLCSSSPVNLLAERRPVGCNSLSSTEPLKRRRLLCSLVIGGRLAASFLELRRLLIPARVSGRRVVFLSLLVTLVERRPIDVLALASIFSSSRRDAFGEAVLLRCGFWLPLLLELASWRADGPKWFVPGEEPAPLTC